MSGLIFHLIPHTHWDREWYLPRAAFQARLVPALDDVLEQYGGDDKAVAVVSHGTVIALLLEQVGGGGAFDVWRAMKLPSFAVLRRPDLSVEERTDQIR